LFDEIEDQLTQYHSVEPGGIVIHMPNDRSNIWLILEVMAKSELQLLHRVWWQLQLLSLEYHWPHLH